MVDRDLIERRVRELYFGAHYLGSIGAEGSGVDGDVALAFDTVVGRPVFAWSVTLAHGEPSIIVSSRTPRLYQESQPALRSARDDASVERLAA